VAGHAVQVGGRDIGGLFDVVSPGRPTAAPMIGVMVKVDSVDATVQKVAAAGGKATDGFDIMDAGRMAVCHDPNGAQFDLWQPKRMQGTDVDAELPGAPSWFETMTTDVDRATEFYEQVFGWTTELVPIPGGASYTDFKLGKDFVAGMLAIRPDMGNTKPQWSTYFTVKGVDETAREATKRGGTICVPATDVPNVGRFCGLMSPQGVPFFVIRYAR
jgi:predicted enzyme related to lactoylglutathione lyase